MHILISEFMDAPAADADALIVRNRSKVDAALLQAAPRLRAVGRLGVGLDNIDLDGCAARNIAVIPATGANARAVAEYVVGAMLMLLRGAYGSTAEVAAGAWPRNALSQGGIGRLTASLAQGLGMRVAGCDAALPPDHPAWRETGVTALPLDELLAQADAITLHLPLTPGTRRLMDAGRIARMRPGAVLINTSRGGIVDEAALADALRTGHLRGAALDVFEQEPLPAGSPLAGAPNLILTPHIAGLTQEANTRVSDMVAAGVTMALTGGDR
jgi:(S)-sulfolactate dehydrogenase